MKSQLAAAMKARCPVSNAWLADRLAMGQPASASQFARRWMLDSNRKRSDRALVVKSQDLTCLSRESKTRLGFPILR
jgi:hypothetical protein